MGGTLMEALSSQWRFCLINDIKIRSCFQGQNSSLEGGMAFPLFFPLRQDKGLTFTHREWFNLVLLSFFRGPGTPGPCSFQVIILSTAALSEKKSIAPLSIHRLRGITNLKYLLTTRLTSRVVFLSLWFSFTRGNGLSHPLPLIALAKNPLALLPGI